MSGRPDALLFRTRKHSIQLSTQGRNATMTRSLQKPVNTVGTATSGANNR